MFDGSECRDATQIINAATLHVSYTHTNAFDNFRISYF